MLYRRGLVIILAIFALLGQPLYAEEAEQTPPAGDETAAEGEESAEGAEGEEGEQMSMPNTGSIYIPLKPPFVVNYGGAGRLRYLKADITVRLQDAGVANSVRHHMPYIRNNLVMLFSAQTDESINSQEGKEALRQEALKEVRDVIMQEDKREGVVDLYFNTILVQR